MPKDNTKRVRSRDIEDAIFKPSAEEDERNSVTDFKDFTVDRSVAAYTMLGKHEYMDDDNCPRVESEDSDETLAKTIFINGNTRYLVKRDSSGKLFNPLGIDEGRHNKFLHHAGKDEFEFRPVNKKAFVFYLQFLKTKNLAHLRTAEREVF